MPLYVVVHHQRDESQPCVNGLVGDELIEAIQTTSEIGHLYQRAEQCGGRVHVHRCGLGIVSPWSVVLWGPMTGRGLAVLRSRCGSAQRRRSVRSQALAV